MKKPGKIYAAVFLPRDNVLSKENRGDKIPISNTHSHINIVVHGKACAWQVSGIGKLLRKLNWLIKVIDRGYGHVN